MQKVPLSVRKAVNSVLILGGVAIIAVQILMIAETGNEMLVVAIGIMMVYMGVWDLASRLLPNRRVYRRFRSDVDEFLDLARELNALAADGDTAGVQRTRARMVESIDQLVETAGVKNGSA